MEWAIEECLKTSLPVAASMCIGPEGDMHGVSAAECGIRMAKAGAHVVGINCHFDPFVSLECLKKMKAGLDAANLKPYLMCQVNFTLQGFSPVGPVIKLTLFLNLALNYHLPSTIYLAYI